MSEEKKASIKSQKDKTGDGEGIHERNSSQESIEKNSKMKQIEEPQRDEKLVVLSAEAYKTIILYASRFANQSIPPEDWKEIYGVLTGYHDEEFVYVQDAAALTFGHATDVQLDERHYGFIADIQDKLNKNEFIVGWFHSHPGLGLFFSYIDLINHLGFQAKNDDAVGLVFDHTLLGKKKQEPVEGTPHTITKYETGFEIYRLNDVNMDVNSPDYDNNYHKVEYVVKGLNKFFFANLLTELSALVSEGKPLQSAYREELQEDNSTKTDENKVRNNMIESSKETSSNRLKFLDEIPIEEDVLFTDNDLFYGKQYKKSSKISNKRETAEELIYQGNEAFARKDIFVAVEKYRSAIKIYKDIKDFERLMDILNYLSENLISSNHLILAEEFASQLHMIAEQQNFMFYKGEASYLNGYLLLKRGKNELLLEGLNKIQDAAVIFEKVEDYVGAALCFHKIGSIYQSRLNKIDNACLFYREAIQNYNRAILKNHPLRKTLWSNQEVLIQKILELKDLIEDLLPKIADQSMKKKIEDDLNSIVYNF